MRPQRVTVVQADVPAGSVDAVLDVLSVTDFTPTAWEDIERGSCRVELFLDDPAMAEIAIAAIVAAGEVFGLELVPVVATLEAEEWAESWKRFFKVERVSPRVVVRPVWEEYQAAQGEVVIDIEPGLSFGTGRHETTRSCLQFLDKIAAEQSGATLLDMGCGSGILAICGAKLGFSDVCGFDNDPDAVVIAAENSALNGVTVEFFHADLNSNKRSARIVVANILGPVLIEHAAVIAAAVEREAGGGLVISGILDTQYADVVAAFSPYGLVEHESIKDGEWRSGWLVIR
ncbi:MAG: methyltransferase [Lentisphaerae bacterium]|jgi:ribosomal protein L11 methyltransferase|nr:methyltransferase [Lentisphaerota bacterium]